MIEQIKQTAAYIRSQVQEIPTTAIILGTGLGALVDHIEDKNTFPIRRFPISLYQQLKGIAVISFLANSATLRLSPCRDGSTTMKVMT